MSYAQGLQPLTPLYTIFDRQVTPLVYLSVTNGTPFACLQSWTKEMENLYLPSAPAPAPPNQGWEMARFGFWLHP